MHLELPKWKEHMHFLSYKIEQSKHHANEKMNNYQTMDEINSQDVFDIHEP